MDQYSGRSNRGEKNSKHAEFGLFLSEPPGLTHQIDNLVNNIGIGVGIRPIDLNLDEVEGEQFEDEIESRLDDFGIARFESENDRLEMDSSLSKTNSQVKTHLQNPSLTVGGYKESHRNKREIGLREEAGLRGKR
ncbi:hypothetical protein CMV_016682 [Castanea mollissima]|uniref:Uncharacterized protein n=1 Tax=Castanea mollissima TaxID=60419 RepID=A0A8J4R6I5_9ROSI|nr:hypothetical protein CMV_016682 [Castanea mollissima]